MTVFSAADFDNHENVTFVSDPASGLRGIIAIHSTARGPALGGCRMYPYATEADAIRDVLRLSRGMSYTAAAAGVRLGGGKSVILGDPRVEKTEALLRAMGRAIEKLNGRYIVGEDIGTNPRDMAIIGRETRSVSCLDVEDGGYGDPAGFTALGVLQAIRAGLAAARGSDSLSGIKVAVQGVGNVGYNLCLLLEEAGAALTVCDPLDANVERVAWLGAQRVGTDEIFAADVDVFAPCAIGAVLNETTIAQLKAQVVAGAANNQLATPDQAEALARRGILYLPDYVANGGGLMSCAAEWYRTDPAAIHPQVLGIFDTCRDILAAAARDGTTPSSAADAEARRRIEEADVVSMPRRVHG